MKSIKKSKADIVYGDVEATSDEMNLIGAKIRITMMIDLDVVDKFRALAKKTGSKYQTLMNKKLRESLNEERVEEQVLKRIALLENAVYGKRGSKYSKAS